jgi:hypothetical protein
VLNLFQLRLAAAAIVAVAAPHLQIGCATCPALPMLLLLCKL